MMDTFLILLGVLAIFFLAFLLFRTAALSRENISIPEADLAGINAGLVAGRLGKLIQCRTISTLGSDPVERGAYPAVQALSGLHRALQEMYPLTHRNLKVETLGGYSLLYTWAGSDPELKPILILAHQDVTPVEEGTEAAWDEDPYAGKISTGYIWGRGTLDFKCGLAGSLEAVEWLLQQGFKPQRSVCLAFGHDEELGGFHGARQLASALQKRGITFENVLDEGGLVLDRLLPGVHRPAALVGITEKGYLSLELSVDTAGGHSSLASGETSIGILCRALGRIEAEPLPAHPVYMRRLLRKMAPELPFGIRFLAANDWLFGRALEQRFSRSARMNAIIRTSSAVTMVAAGVKDNVLPRHARALVNLRLFPGERIPDIIAHIERAIQYNRVQVRPVQLSGERYDLHSLTLPGRKPGRLRADGQERPLRMAVQPGEVTRTAGWESPPPTSPDSPSFRQLDVTIRQVYPEAEVVPFLTPAATDSRHYASLSENLLRFSPYRLEVADLERLHGTNERISVENYAQVIQFYIQWIRNNDGRSDAG